MSTDMNLKQTNDLLDEFIMKNELYFIRFIRIMILIEFYIINLKFNPSKWRYNTIKSNAYIKIE